MTYLDDDEDEDDVDDAEDDAVERAAQARRLGTNIVRSHLQSHLDNNPDSSFVTWIATLHPENATVVIDERFFIPGNPWQSVYKQEHEEARRSRIEGPPSEHPDCHGYEHSCTHSSSSSSPIDRSSSSSPSPSSCAPPAAVARSSATTTTATPTTTTQCEALLGRGSPLDLLIGSAVAVTLILTVVGLEVTALVMYWCAAFFWHIMVQCLSPPGTGCYHATLLPFYVIVSLLYHTFALVDAILLLLSVAVGELLAAVQFALSFCLAGCHLAGQWHQYLRRTTHSIRVAFRAPWKRPKRHGFSSLRHWWQDTDSTTHTDDDDDDQDHDDATSRRHRRRPTSSRRRPVVAQEQQDQQEQQYVALQEESSDDEHCSCSRDKVPQPLTAIQTATVYQT